MTSILQMRGIKKRFGGVHALRGVDFAIAKGECVALVGENGAGKSTLMKILGGVHQPDAGEISIDGQPAVIRNVSDSISYGIGFIHQELNVVDNLDVASNAFLWSGAGNRWVSAFAQQSAYARRDEEIFGSSRLKHPD